MEDSGKIFDTLILLVGTNPLPNFVVADYFIKNNPELNDIFLIYSEKTKTQSGTKEYAENLQKLLQSHKERIPNFEFISLSDVSNAREIERDLDKGLKEKLKNKKHIHLNYTGGTKAMVIHVYRWIERYGLKNHIATSFSYLDARTFKIVDDKNGRITRDLRDHMSYSIQELIKLHGFERIDNAQDNEIDREKFEIFKKLINSGEFEKYLEDNKGKVDGKLFEYYVYEVIRRNIKNIDIAINWKIKRQNWHGENQKFEIDIFLVKGYQILGISCTIARNKPLCKSKGFEIFMRTRQIGGDESRAILITTLPENKKIEIKQELEVDTGGGENILVLGIEDLKEDILTHRIQEYIK